MAQNGSTLLKIAQNGSKWLKMAQNISYCEPKRQQKLKLMFHNGPKLDKTALKYPKMSLKDLKISQVVSVRKKTSLMKNGTKAHPKGGRLLVQCFAILLLQ